MVEDSRCRRRESRGVLREGHHRFLHRRLPRRRGESDIDILSSGQDILMSSDDPSNQVPESVSSKAAIAGPILGVLAIIAAVAGALQLPQAQPIMRQLRSLLGV